MNCAITGVNRKAPNSNKDIYSVWGMLQYLYDELRTRRFKDMDISSAETMDELYALVLATWSASVAQEGLYKEYITIEDEEMTSPKGQINIQESIAMQTRSRGTLICSYDELSADNVYNHIVKATLQSMIFNNGLNNKIKTTVKKTMQLYNAVSYIDIDRVRWKDIKYNNSNIRYKHLIEMCKQYLDDVKLKKLGQIDDDKRMYLLFKKQVFKYFKAKYGNEDTVGVIELPYTLDSEPLFEKIVNKSQRVVVIKTEKMAHLIVVRLNDDLMRQDIQVVKQRLNEIVQYAREYQAEYKLQTSGTLCYVNIDKRRLNLQPITINNVDNFMIGETIIDVHDQWRFITNKLDDIYKHFVERSKNILK